MVRQAVAGRQEGEVVGNREGGAVSPCKAWEASTQCLSYRKGKAAWLAQSMSKAVLETMIVQDECSGQLRLLP